MTEKLSPFREKLAASFKKEASAKSTLQEIFGPQRWQKLKARENGPEQIRKLTSRLNHHEDAEQISQLLKTTLFFMPEDVFDQLIQGELEDESGYFKYHGIEDYLGAIYARTTSDYFGSTPDTTLSRVVESAYGCHQNNRFAATAALYALAFAREHGQEGKLNPALQEKLNTNLRRHYQHHQERLARLESIQPNDQEKLRFGVEIELPPHTYMQDEEAGRQLEQLFLEREQLDQRVWKQALSIGEKEGKGQTLLLGAEKATAQRLANKSLALDKKRKALEEIARADYLSYSTRFANEVESTTGWQIERELIADITTAEIKSYPTQDIHLLVHELVLLRKLGYLNYQRLNLQESQDERFFGVHFNTGGIRLEGKQGRLEEDVFLLHHAQEATALATPVTGREIKSVGEVSIQKGEMLDRFTDRKDPGKFSEHGNLFGVERRTFQAFDEPSFLKLLTRYAQKDEALKAFQQLPPEAANRLRSLSDAFLIYPPNPTRPEASTYQYQKGPKGESLERRTHWQQDFEQAKRRYQQELHRHKQSQTEYDQLKYSDPDGALFEQKKKEIMQETDAVLTQLDFADQQKELIRLWVEYRFQVSLAFRLANLPDPSQPWGYRNNEPSWQRADLYKAIGRSARTFADLKKSSPNLAGTEIRLGGKTYKSIIHAMREADLSFGARLKAPESPQPETVTDEMIER